MHTSEVLRATRLLIDAINTVQAVGIDLNRLGSMIDQARAEGRELTDEEIQSLAGANADAMAELDSAIAARKGEPQT